MFAAFQHAWRKLCGSFEPYRRVWPWLGKSTHHGRPRLNSRRPAAVEVSPAGAALRAGWSRAGRWYLGPEFAYAVGAWLFAPQHAATWPRRPLPPPYPHGAPGFFGFVGFAPLSPVRQFRVAAIPNALGRNARPAAVVRRSRCWPKWQSKFYFRMHHIRRVASCWNVLQQTRHCLFQEQR